MRLVNKLAGSSSTATTSNYYKLAGLFTHFTNCDDSRKFRCRSKICIRPIDYVHHLSNVVLV